MDKTLSRVAAVSALALTLTACSDGQTMDFDLRGLTDGFTTAPAAKAVSTTPRPAPDARGVITYPNYQIAVAKRGDTIATVATRVGLSADELARYNGITDGATFREGEVIALPRNATGSATAAGTIATGAQIDVVTLGNDAIAAADKNGGATIVQSTPSKPLSGVEPVRHQVQRGETAYSIARLYGVPVRSLAEWNGLDATLTVQEGRYLLIPTTVRTAAAAPSATDTKPGQGTATPVPPSAAAPLPDGSDATPTAPKPATAPDLGATQSQTSEMSPPVSGKIVRDYDSSKSKSLLFAAPAGTSVKAAKAGTVKLVSRNADGVEFLVIDHGNGLQSAYSFVEGVSVKKGDKVSRGQIIAKAAVNEFSAVQFMVFKGTQTVDPTPFLN